MPLSAADGLQTCVINTEHTLATLSGSSYVLVVDMANMAVGDKTELRIYSKCRTGGTERLAYSRRFCHEQAEPIKYSVPVPADVSFKATIKQTAGTGRSFEWSVLQL